MLKRAYDILFAILFFAVFSPIYLLSAVIIKCTSKGSVLYKPLRVGIHGQVFTLYKFRTMCVDSGPVKLTTLVDDERIYPFGRLLRKTKIDEFPQVLNIFLGQMSVVGPRPEDQDNADVIYVDEYSRILDVKPGLTSPASLYDYTHGEMYGSQEDYLQEFLKKKLDLEVYYVENHGFLYDVKITIKTALIVLQKTVGKTKFRDPKELVLLEKMQRSTSYIE